MRGFFLRFLLTRVVVQNVGTRDPEGVPLGARMRNRVSPVFSGVLTGSDFTLRAKKNENKIRTKFKNIKSLIGQSKEH